MLRLIQISLLFLFLFWVSIFRTSDAFSQDLKGSKDHPLIGRYPNSVIRNYETKDYDEYYVPVGSIPPGGIQKGKYKLVEGKRTKIVYLIAPEPTQRSTLEVLRNYQISLQNAGFETLFLCSDQQCGEAAWEIGHDPNPYSQRMISARLSRAEGEVYVSVFVGESKVNKGTVFVLLTVVEGNRMQTGLVTVDAAAMSKEIAATGHVAVYGIYFDFDKTDIKPESEPALTEIAKLLRQNQTLKILLVGHTDSVGTMGYNTELSDRRAASVANELVSKYGIARARLTAKGVGFLAPVASNRTEDGRAKNRRVELVEME